MQTVREADSEGGKVRNAFFFLVPTAFIMLLLMLCPFVSYTSDELQMLEGGLEGAIYASNILGQLGAHCGGAMLLTFGLASYPIALLLLVCSLRRLFLKESLSFGLCIEYMMAHVMFAIGLSMFLGIWPTAMPRLLEALNIQTLPGGVIGQRITSPTGTLTLFMNDIGSMIISAILVFLALRILFYFDWKDFFKFGGGNVAYAAAAEGAEPEAVKGETAPEIKKQGLFSKQSSKPEPIAMTQEDLPLDLPRTESRKVTNNGNYTYPDTSLLDKADSNGSFGASAKEIEENTSILQKTLDDFHVRARVVNQISGPQVTMYEILPDTGIRLNSITVLENDIKMALGAISIRIQAPIPGEKLVGVEVPNATRSIVPVRSLMEDKTWKNAKETIPLLLGKNIKGKSIILDLAKAPHLLIGGTTGSGKSVCMNMLITSLLYKFSPEELKLIMIDPKVVEFAAYSKLPHLITPVINDASQGSLALRWAVNEMERRYGVLACAGVRNLSDYNHRNLPSEPVLDKDGQPIPDKLPFIVIVIDELADIMMVARKEMEYCLQRLAQKSRAVGIHTILATQRPDTKVLTGTIKSNYPVRIALRASSQIDSQTILGHKGAETLLGLGDMLYIPPNAGCDAIERIQCGMASDDERNRIVEFCAMQAEQHFEASVLAQMEEADGAAAPSAASNAGNEREDKASVGSEEALLRKAMEVILTSKRATTSYVQRQLGIGYNKAANLMEKLEKRGMISPQNGSSAPREIYIHSMDEFDEDGQNTEFDEYP